MKENFTYGLMRGSRGGALGGNAGSLLNLFSTLPRLRIAILSDYAEARERGECDGHSSRGSCVLWKHRRNVLFTLLSPGLQADWRAGTCVQFRGDAAAEIRPKPTR